jgi:hypothetical protein
MGAPLVLEVMMMVVVIVVLMLLRPHRLGS